MSSDIEDIREAICAVNQRLVESGLVTLTWGNVSPIDSTRTLMAIKPSGVDYATLQPDHIVLVDLNGSVRVGDLHPPSDIPTQVWVPVIQGSKGPYHYLQSVQGYLAPPIFVVFFFGVLMKRLNAKGCLAALLVGFALGLFRLAVDTPVTLGMSGYEHGYTEGSFLWVIQNMYFQYYSVIIFLVSLATLIGVSYATAPPCSDRIQGLTFGTLSDEDRRKSRASWGAGDVVTSIVVMIIIVVAYLYFRG